MTHSKHPEIGRELRYDDLLVGMLVAAYAESQSDLILNLWVTGYGIPGAIGSSGFAPLPRCVILHSHTPHLDVKLYVEPDGSFRDWKGTVIRLHERRGPVDDV